MMSMLGRVAGSDPARGYATRLSNWLGCSAPNGSQFIIRIIVDGPPIGKGRPRFIRATGRAYTPTKTVNYEAILAAAGGSAMGRSPPLEGPLIIRVTAFMPIAASWTKKKVADALEGRFRPGKPDSDNIIKCVGDSLNGIVWRDDAQLCEVRISKLYDPDPRLEIEVEPLIVATIVPAFSTSRSAESSSDVAYAHTRRPRRVPPAPQRGLGHRTPQRALPHRRQALSAHPRPARAKPHPMFVKHRGKELTKLRKARKQYLKGGITIAQAAQVFGLTKGSLRSWMQRQKKAANARSDIGPSPREALVLKIGWPGSEREAA